METRNFIYGCNFVYWELFVPVKGVRHITSKEAKDKFKDNKVQFVDVRTQGEYRSNHRKPFRNIPLHTLKNRLGELQKDKEVVVIRQSGVRSMKAAKILKKTWL